MTENQAQPTYPDISELLAAKARRRRELAALSWEDKVAIVEQMQQLLPRDAWKSRPAAATRNTQYPTPALPASASVPSTRQS